MLSASFISVVFLIVFGKRNKIYKIIEECDDTVDCDTQAKEWVLVGEEDNMSIASQAFNSVWNYVKRDDVHVVE